MGATAPTQTFERSARFDNVVDGARLFAQCSGAANSRQFFALPRSQPSVELAFRLL
jgi:hypothetical protein